MKEQLISFETAKLAKEKGFDETTFKHYGRQGDILSGATAVFYSAPSQSILQKWLREEKKIWIEPTYNRHRGVEPYYCNYELLFSSATIKTTGWHDTYEEALEEGLKEALKLCESK